MTTIKRIFITGAPGSMWSSVDRYLRFHCLPHIDNSDMNADRMWRGHTGTYHNPGNEPFYDWILGFGDYSKEEIIEKLDSVYDPIPEGTDFIIRTYKSHMFVYHFDKIREMFPDADIIATTNVPYKSLLWWQICGGMETVFDSYDSYNRDVEKIWEDLLSQTDSMNKWISDNNVPGTTLNIEWLEKHFGKGSVYSYRSVNEVCYGSDNGILWANQSFYRNLANTTTIHIQYGTERRIP